MELSFFESNMPHGEVTRQLYSSANIKEALEKKTGLNFDDCHDKNGLINFNALCLMALDAGVSKDELKAILDQNIKSQFADNFLWRFIRKNFNLDLAIPFITGRYTKKALKANLVTNVGHAAFAGQFGGSTSAAFTAMAYGSGSTPAAVTDTALQTEVARGAATISRVTTSVANDTYQAVKTFTAGGTQAITEEGILDNNTSGGNLAAHNVFSAVNMILNDTLQFTHKIQS
jgi:hypothetical protein